MILFVDFRVLLELDSLEWFEDKSNASLRFLTFYFDFIASMSFLFFDSSWMLLDDSI